jgi:hypothetical protein
MLHQCVLLFVEDYLIKTFIAVFPQPVSSPDLVSADCYLFPKLNAVLMERGIQPAGKVKNGTAAVGLHSSEFKFHVPSTASTNINCNS